jgi:hypothetical protein
MIRHCFQDDEVLELVRKQWQSPAPVVSVQDPYGNRVHLVQEPVWSHRSLVSPYGSGIALAGTLPADVRADNLLGPLVDRLLERVADVADAVVRVGIPGYFFEGRPFALLEPFLQRGFSARLELWERVVDLAATPEAIVAGCTPMVRRKIRRGLAKGVRARIHYAERVPESLMRALYDAARHTRERGGGRLKHSLDAYLDDRHRLLEAGKAALATVEHDGFVGYLLVLVSEDVAFYFDGAWTGQRSEFANHLLHYEAMLFARGLGCRRYSMGYVFPDLVSPSEHVAGMARFKHGLGSDLLPLYTLTFVKQSRVGAVTARLRRSRLAPLLGRLRRLAAV